VLTFSLILLAIWSVHIQNQLWQNTARIDVLLSCTPGTPMAAVESHLNGRGKPREMDSEGLKSWFKNLSPLSGGKGLFYDSYGATDMFGGPRLPEFVVLLDRTDHVTGVVFLEHD
jgi:hypothetical protein